MSTPRRVFRPIALQRHEVAATRAVVPHVVAPRFALWICVLIGLLAAGGAVAATARVPVVAAGWAVIDAETGTNGHAVVLLESSQADRLHAGQTVTLDFPGMDRLDRTVAAVEPAAIDPAEARRRWPSAPVAGTSSLVVALVPLDPDATISVGRVGRADVDVGSRSVGSLLPLVGRLFGG